MKITEKWLKKHNACSEGIEFYKGLNETNLLKLTKLLIRGDRCEWARWLLGEVIWDKKYRWKRYYEWTRHPRRKIRRRFYEFRHFLEKLFNVKKIKIENVNVWFKENGFIHIKQNEVFGHYFRIDPLNDKVGQKIKWHYDDSTDCYYVKWQMWTGTKNKKRLKIYPTPKRKDKVEWECETDNERFTAYYTEDSFHKMMKYIKEHSEEKFELMRDYMKKKGYEA